MLRSKTLVCINRLMIHSSSTSTPSMAFCTCSDLVFAIRTSIESHLSSNIPRHMSLDANVDLWLWRTVIVAGKSMREVRDSSIERVAPLTSLKTCTTTIRLWSISERSDVKYLLFIRPLMSFMHLDIPFLSFFRLSPWAEIWASKSDPSILARRKICWRSWKWSLTARIVSLVAPHRSSILRDASETSRTNDIIWSCGWWRLRTCWLWAECSRSFAHLWRSLRSLKLGRGDAISVQVEY